MQDAPTSIMLRPFPEINSKMRRDEKIFVPKRPRERPDNLNNGGGQAVDYTMADSCREIQPMLDAWLDRELSPEPSRRVEAHV